MTESSNLTNRNFLSPLNWRFNLVRSPSVNFFIQECNIPDIAFPKVPMVPNPLVDYPVAPDSIVFGDLKIIFKVDEDLQNFYEIYKWMKDLGTPERLDDFATLDNPQAMMAGKGVYSDITIEVQNAQHATKFYINYIDALPTFLGNIKLVTTDQDVNYVTAGVAFKYTSYDIKPYT